MRRTLALVRAFAPAAPGPTLAIGFDGQSPTGAGRFATRDDVSLTPVGVADLRDGS